MASLSIGKKKGSKKTMHDARWNTLLQHHVNRLLCKTFQSKNYTVYPLEDERPLFLVFPFLKF